MNSRQHNFIVANEIAVRRSNRFSLLLSFGKLMATASFTLCVMVILSLSITQLTPTAHATKDYVVPVKQSELRMPAVRVTAKRPRGGGRSSSSSVLFSGGGGFSPFGGYGPIGDEYYFMQSCSRRKNESDLCKNVCFLFPNSEECKHTRDKEKRNPKEEEETLPTIEVEEQKTDDRKKLKLLNQRHSSPPLILEPVEAIVQCSNRYDMKFPRGSHRERSIVTGVFYRITFRKERLYKLVREAVDELALPGKDGEAIDWRRGQEGGFYIYWNRVTGKFRIGKISKGNLYSNSVTIHYSGDNMTRDEIRIGVLHTQPSTVSPSFHDIQATRRMVKQNTLSVHAKDFIAAVKIDDQGNSYVELRMYDFLTMPLTDEEIGEGTEIERNFGRPDYPYQTFSQYSLTIDAQGNEAGVSNSQSDCSE